MGISSFPILSSFRHFLAKSWCFLKKIPSKRQREGFLIDAQHEMETVLNNTEEFFLVVDKNYKLLMANKSALDNIKHLLGVDLKMGDSVLIINPPGQEEALAKFYAHVLSGNKTQKRYITNNQDGSSTVFLATYTPIKNLKGEYDRIMISSRDITAEETAFRELQNLSEERKMAEEKVRMALIEKQKILDSSLDIICSIDLEGRFILVSPASLAIWGYSPMELEGRKYIDFVVEEDREATLKGALEVMSGNTTNNFQNRYRHKNGSTVTMTWSASWVEGEEIMYCVARDATERQMSEKALQRSEANYRAIFHRSPLPIWIYDLETFRIQEINESAIRHYGYSREEALSKTIQDILFEEDILALEKEVKEAILSGNVELGEWRHRKANGQLIYVEVTGQLIEYKDKTAMMIICHDITERKHHVQAIEDQNVKLKEIAWVQSHVVRAPLARMMGLVQLLKRPELTEAERDTVLIQVNMAANELDLIIRDIVKKTEQIQLSPVD
jgi:PAS domain S-box-containing protein